MLADAGRRGRDLPRRGSRRRWPRCCPTLPDARAAPAGRRRERARAARRARSTTRTALAGSHARSSRTTWSTAGRRRPVPLLHGRHHRHAQGRAVAPGRLPRRRRSGSGARTGRTSSDLDEFVAAAPAATLRALPAPPLMHGAAHWNAMSCWIAGGTVVIQDDIRPPRPADVLATRRPRARHVAADRRRPVRPAAGRRAATDRRGTYDVSARCATCSSAGPCCRPALKTELLEPSPGVTIVDVLGSTETGRQGVARRPPPAMTTDRRRSRLGHGRGAQPRT